MVAKSPQGAKGAAELHAYWTKDPRGLAKWAEKPDPWTALFHELREHLAEPIAKRTASKWYHEVFGVWPGSDAARVMHGKPPRGKLIGPG